MTKQEILNLLGKIHDKVAEEIYLPITIETDGEDFWIEVTLAMEKDKFNPFCDFYFDKYGFVENCYLEPTIVESNRYKGDYKINDFAEWIIDHINHFCCKV